MSREFYVPCTPYVYQIRSKLPTFHNPLKRFMKSKSEREVNSEVENVNHCEIRSFDLEKIDELANPDSVSTLNEQDTAKSNASVYRPEHHPMDAARTRESYQDLASYFSEVDPDEPSTSATNTIVLSASTFDHDVERTEPSENLQSTTMTSTVSTSFGSEITDTVSNSMNTEEVSDADFTDRLQRGTIVAVAPMELAFSAQLGKYSAQRGLTNVPFDEALRSRITNNLISSLPGSQRRDDTSGTIFT